MSPWSQDEVNRTMSEVKRRSVRSPEFRALALTDPHAAIAKVNPRPLPTGVSVKFVETAKEGSAESSCDTCLVILLPSPVAWAGELTEAELERAAGGYDTNIKFPSEE